MYSLREGAAPSLQCILADSQDGVTSVAFSADSKLLASGSLDRVARVYTLGGTTQMMQRLLAT